MSRYSISYMNKKQFVDGMNIMFEIKEVREDNEVIDSKRVVADRAYYEYLEWRERYAQGLISDETLEMILEGDDLLRFKKDGDFVRGREGIDSATMDARIIATKEFEANWNCAMIARIHNPTAWGAALSKILSDIFKDYDTAVLSNGSSAVSLAASGGSTPPTANKVQA